MSYYQYINNIIHGTAFFNTDSGVVFEFTPVDISVYPDNVGFGDVSAVSIIDIPSSLLNNLFYIQLTDRLDITNVNIKKYGINSLYKFNLLFSSSIISNSDFFLNKSINLSLANDYLTYLAYSRTGTTNVDVLSNKNDLYQAVIDMDKGFNQYINNNITYLRIGSPSQYFLSNDLTNPYAHSTKQLVTGMLTIANPIRKNIFLNNLIDQSFNNTQNLYWIPFHSGDKMSIVIKYVSVDSNIKTRSYKIILNCLASFIFPNYVSNVGYNPNGNLDPFYVLLLLNNMLINSGSNPIQNINASFISAFNSFGMNYTDNDPNTKLIALFKKIGFVLNPMDFYYKLFISNINQPSNVMIDSSGNGYLMNNGINLSFQYIFLNSTITQNLYPSLRSIKRDLLTSSYNLYPTLNDIKDIQCDLNFVSSQHFIIRIYTRPNYTIIDNVIDNSFNVNDSFYGNFYDSDISGIINREYTTYHLTDLFSYWNLLIRSEFNQPTFYPNIGSTILTTYGQQQILSICILTYDINANIGIKNIVVTYK
jgi:hypothetical protein